MLHPLFSTVVQRPDLVVDHLSAYAALFHDEAVSAGTDLLTRAAAWVVAVLTAVVFLGLTGVAVMLGWMQNQFHWALVIVPGVALLLVVAAILRAIKPWQTERFPELKAQIDSDIRALRMVG
jgi:type IV secretory pathway VirB2 component (pilin)